MKKTIRVCCDGCGDEINEGDAINGFCYPCVKNYRHREKADTLAQEAAMRLCEHIGQQGYKGSFAFICNK